MQASTAYGQPERELVPAVAVPPELLKTVARAVAADFATSGLDVADLAGFAVQWRARVTAPVQ